MAEADTRKKAADAATTTDEAGVVDPEVVDPKDTVKPDQLSKADIEKAKDLARVDDAKVVEDVELPASEPAVTPSAQENRARAGVEAPDSWTTTGDKAIPTDQAGAPAETSDTGNDPERREAVAADPEQVRQAPAPDSLESTDDKTTRGETEAQETTHRDRVVVPGDTPIAPDEVENSKGSAEGPSDEVARNVQQDNPEGSERATADLETAKNELRAAEQEVPEEVSRVAEQARGEGSGDVINPDDSVVAPDADKVPRMSADQARDRYEELDVQYREKVNLFKKLHTDSIAARDIADQAAAIDLEQRRLDSEYNINPEINSEHRDGNNEYLKAFEKARANGQVQESRVPDDSLTELMPYELNDIKKVAMEQRSNLDKTAPGSAPKYDQLTRTIDDIDFALDKSREMFAGMNAAEKASFAAKDVVGRAVEGWGRSRDTKTADVLGESNPSYVIGGKN